jgi:glycosyltransferase involved in cell wall biosynthesis
MSVDLSLIVTAHDETAVCGPTMRAADLAVAAARERGFTVQTLIGLDTPTEATSSYFHQPRFDHWERRVLQERDLGRVRNALVPECEGRYIAFLDADDLFSENWLAEGVAALEAAAERGESAIAHPELNVVFDGTKTVYVNIDQSSPLFAPEYLYFRHYYDSLCMAPRQAHLDIPYVTRDVPNGLSYQDFQFTIESLGEGWRHRVVKDTIIFKRRRDVSLVTESNIRKSLVRALPAMAIDRIRELGSARR